MAVYRIFPEKDTFIFTDRPTGNAGKDEIIELGGYPNSSIVGETNRILMKFSDTDITDVVDNIIGNTNFNANIHLYLADAGSVPVGYTLYAYPIFITGSIEWDNGYGQYNDLALNSSGVSWEYIQVSATTPWITGSYPTGVTGSWVNGKAGGAAWYLTSSGEIVESSQTHELNSDHDVDLDVTTAVKQFYTGSLLNKGFVIKLQDEYEFYTSSSIRLRYFGRDSSTIYPPFLEFKWDDSSYATGSLSVLSTDISTITIKNNKGRYKDEGKQRFRMVARPIYPARAFVTSSVYLTTYALPQNSYWGLKDETTEEMIFGFDTQYTKVSCDSTGPYFDVYMGGLQPERYYRILIKTQLDGSDVIIDNQNIFKVVRNG